ncbi:hypothetical protein CHUV2995_02138 [Corynebacterium diphtheriae subsp. lausannense]|nr:hypothetical protein CHUV2995_02138 [Corynebacterium diphtheriae subsp. lausannense]
MLVDGHSGVVEVAEQVIGVEVPASGQRQVEPQSQGTELGGADVVEEPGAGDVAHDQQDLVEH